MDDQQGLSMGFSVNQPPGTPAPLIAQPVGMPQGPMLVQVQLPQMQMGSGNTPPPMHSREMMERGQFICAHCHTTHVTSQLGRGGSSRRKGSNGNVGQSQQMGKDQNKNRKPRPARPRSAMIDGQKVLLCNACGIFWQRKGQKRPLKPVKRTSARKKPKITMAKEESPFYHHVAELFSVQDADLLWCDCSQQCTTKYLMPDPGDKDSLNREECIALVEIHKKAIQLKKIKSFPKDEKSPGGPDSGQQMMMMPNQMGIVLATPTNQGSQSNDDSLDKGFRGYGRGHASSKEYERYVFQYIDYCKAKKLCGKFRKKLLSFSNDWLYKRPTLRTTITTGTDDKVTTKVEVYKGKPRVMQEKKFEHTPEELKTATCCNKLCCQKIWTNQIAQWRREYVEGNNDQRWNVIQQMLLGEGYGSSKCVNVVRMITGCSRNLVASVSNYLQVNQSTGRPPSQSAKQEQVDRQQRDHGQQQIPQQLQHQPLETIKSNPMQLAQQAAQQMSMNQHMLYGQSPNYNSAVPPLPPVLSNLVTATITHPAQMQPMSQQQQQQMASLFYVQQQK